MKITKRVLVTPHLCTGCGTCRLECALAHSAAGDIIACATQDPAAEPRLKLTAAKSNAPFDTPVPVIVQCRHCEEPACVAACKFEAMTQCAETGLVFTDRETCVGCRACIKACPYGAVWMVRDGEKSVIKCDLCIGPLREGLEPACVCGCPTGALRFDEPGEQDGIPVTNCVTDSEEEL
jgi:anaerobic carbon-monoxide dehydrogenase iron sulfur subunit